MKANPKITDIQKGKKIVEMRRNIEAKIRISIFILFIFREF